MNEDLGEREYRARRAAGIELAEELRSITDALVEHDPALAALTMATELARELRSHLGGPKRVRWHDAEPGGGTDAPPEYRNAWADGSPFVGRIHPGAPPMRVDKIDDDGRPTLEGRVRVRPAFEGPPGGVHGGVVAGLFDELLGAVPGGLLGVPAVTGTLKLRYLARTPLARDLRFTAWVEAHRGRRIVVRGACHDGDVLTAQAEGLFVQVAFEASGP